MNRLIDSPHDQNTNSALQAAINPNGGCSNQVTPTSASFQNVVVELHSVAKEEQRTWDSVDIKAKVNHRVQTVVWPRSKYPDFDSKIGGKIKNYIQGELKMPDQEFHNRWSTIKKQINNHLRTKRAYVVQQMKTVFLSECRCQPLSRLLLLPRN